MKKTFINLVATALAFSISIGINFFLTPYIVGAVGVAAYGFVALANDFIAYVSIVALALNSMAGRFITIAMHQGDNLAAREYYASTIGANALLAAIIFMLALPFIYVLDLFLNIPAELLTDVRALFALTLVNFLINMVLAVVGVAYIIENRLYLQSLVQIRANVIRAGLLIALFYFLPAHIAYLGAATVVAAIITKSYDYYYQRKLAPSLVFRISLCKLARLREVLSAGIWSSVTRVGNILAGNLDLLLVNVLLTPVDMGRLAVVKIVPTFLTTVTGLMAGVYMPNFLKLYAAGDTRALTQEIITAMKVFALVLGVPLVVLLGLGDRFFALWMPGEYASVLYILSVLSLVAILVIGPAALLHNVFTVVNRVRVNSILIVITGLLNTGAALVVLNYTDLGLYGLVGVTALVSLVRNACYTVPWGALYLGEPWYRFIPVLLRAVAAVLVVTATVRLTGLGASVTDWLSFALAALGLALALGIVMLYMMFSRAERHRLAIRVHDKVCELRERTK